ncbi:TPA: hypothetical protein DDW35_10750 [Candidatus Sumerlaeota bacterium]|jgi:hypothetical protein|nr:hypothetical protein [Candidatus Sumerlaeota bacterium]
MLSHLRIPFLLFLFIFIGCCIAFAADAPHAASTPPPGSLHAPGEKVQAQKSLPTSLLSSKATPSASAGTASATSESQTVTYDPRLLLPAGKTVEAGKIIPNENVLILEGVEVYLQDRRSQLSTSLAMECVDAATGNRVKDGEQDIRRAIATTVGRYTIQKVSTLEGKIELRDDITRAINQAIGTTGIKDVYFQMFTLISPRK